mgnify:CR=1 FL=1
MHNRHRLALAAILALLVAPTVGKAEEATVFKIEMADGRLTPQRLVVPAGKPFKMGMVFPVSTHNYELRYWLAAGGLNPGFYTPSDVSGTKNADVLLSVTPPPQMPATLEAGTINGYCVGEPWNQQAVFKGIGVPVVTDLEIWKNNPEKVFGVAKSWADKNPNTHVAVIKALMRACMWLDASMANRVEAVKILSRPNYVGADAAVIGNSMTGTFEYEKGDKRPLPDFNVFFRYFATYPYRSEEHTSELQSH